MEKICFINLISKHTDFMRGVLNGLCGLFSEIKGENTDTEKPTGCYQHPVGDKLLVCLCSVFEDTVILISVLKSDYVTYAVYPQSNCNLGLSYLRIHDR